MDDNKKSYIKISLGNISMIGNAEDITAHIQLMLSGDDNNKYEIEVVKFTSEEIKCLPGFLG